MFYNDVNKTRGDSLIKKPKCIFGWYIAFAIIYITSLISGSGVWVVINQDGQTGYTVEMVINQMVRKESTVIFGE